MKYFEDFQVGDKFELGTYTVTKEEIITFARQFDPQLFHLDEEAAKHTPLRGLCASGWHTAAIAMRLLVDGFSAHNLGSPGADQIRWLIPLRPDDTVQLKVEIADMKVSTSKPDRGTIWIDEKLFNQRGELIMTKRSIGIMRRRSV